MNAPRADVAVIIPAHRAEATLGAALASVAAQSVQPGEVVVVDDGSDDDTLRVARSWGALLPLSVLRNERPLGPSEARRLAISRSSSSLIALLDADDVWLPDHLETLLDTYARSPGLVSADALRWIPGQALARTSQHAEHPIPPPDVQLPRLLAGNYVFGAVLFAREAYERVGGFRGSAGGSEDWDLWIRMVRAGIRVTATGHPTMVYRLSRGSLSADERTLAAHVRMLEQAAEEASDEEQRRLIRSTLRSMRARAALEAAYAAARDGRGWSARGLAIAGLRGSRAVRMRSVTMLLAPALGVRLRDRWKWSERRWLKP